MRHLLLAVLVAALPAAAQNDPPMPEMQVACGTLVGEGQVRLVFNGRVLLGPFALVCGERT